MLKYDFTFGNDSHPFKMEVNVWHFPEVSETSVESPGLIVPSLVGNYVVSETVDGLAVYDIEGRTTVPCKFIDELIDFPKYVMFEVPEAFYLGRLK